MTTHACPWSIPAPAAPTAADNSSATSSPQTRKTMQDIMDEALALQLYEEECRGLERELNAAVLSSRHTFAHMQERNDDGSAVQRLGADSFADAENDASDESDDATDESDGVGDDEQKAAVPVRTVPRPVARTTAATSSTPQPFVGMKKQLYDRSIAVDDAGKGFNSIRESLRRHDKLEKNGLASGRVETSKLATRDGVLDERTQRILQKLINRGDLDAVHGCVQSGKEAHVYYAVGSPDSVTTGEQPSAFAVKVFKTTRNAFSNRHEYVTGDRRFDLHYCKKSMRRQLATWTEKEYRNLCRAAQHVRVPAPLLFKDHVLVMAFVGYGTSESESSTPAPTLKDATLSLAQCGHAYADVLQAIRTLYQDAHLVHADLSEYNILVRKQRCWLIDFGQATDRTHPQSIEYLTRDLHNVTTFFQRAGLPAATSDTVGWLEPDVAMAFVTAVDAPRDVLAPFPLLRALIDDKYQRRLAV